MNPLVKNIIQAAEIPSIPHILQRILSLADNPRTSSADLEKYVVQEPALAAQLLKWVNSAAYALSQRVSSIAHAMIMLGFSTVKSVASGMLLIDAFDEITGLTKDYIHHVWGHTLRTAALIKILAKREGGKKGDDYFLAAMIHDVGYLVLKQHFREKYDVLLKITPYPGVELERKNLGIDHAEIGYELLVQWRFAQTVCDMVKFHHNPEQYPGNKRDVYYMLLCDRMAYNKQLQGFLAQPSEAVDPEIIRLLGVLEWSWQGLLVYKDKMIESLKEIETLFGP